MKVFLGIFASLLAFGAIGARAEVDTSLVAKYACVGLTPSGQRGAVNVPKYRIAEAILIAAQYPPSLLGVDNGYEKKVVQALTERPKGMDDATSDILSSYVLTLSYDLADGESPTPKELGLKVTDGKPGGPPEDIPEDWFLADNVKIQCIAASPRKTDLQNITTISIPPRLGLVASVDDLAKTSSDRKAANSALINLNVQTVPVDDGSDKRTTKLQFDGTLGLRITPDNEPATAFAFVTYNLSSARNRPAPVLAAGKRLKDGDTNALKVGVALTNHFVGKWGLTGQVAYVDDYIKGSRRALAYLTLRPGFEPHDLGACGVGYLKPMTAFGIYFRSQCSVGLLAGYSHVFRAGRAVFTDEDDFTSFGVTGTIQTTPPLFQKSGFVSSLSYTYEPTVTGNAPDIDRWDGSLKYRWWLDSGVGVDFGGTLKHGQNPITYTYEDVVSLSFGILY